MIGCKYCVQTYPDFVRTKLGQQRSGYRLLAEHTRRYHSLVAKRTAFGTPARVDDTCPHCEGRGCLECEPDGPVSYNFNTLEKLTS